MGAVGGLSVRPKICSPNFKFGSDLWGLGSLPLPQLSLLVLRSA
jgi:hypothetical protein